ncbi:uncharacterized protein LOC144440576 [Glandiceps talaboti]
MNFHLKIRNEFGKSCLDNVRRLEKTCIKIARYRNHLRFNLHCKHHNVTPKSLQLKSTVKGDKANSILKRSEKQLLNVRIGQNVHKLNLLNKDKVDAESRIAESLPEDVATETRSRCQRSQIREHDTSKKRQQAKFAHLADKDRKDQVKTNLASECISKWVKNCSDRILSDPEFSVLAKGLNFAVTNPEVPVVDIVTQTEVACRNLNERDSNELRSKVVNILMRPKKIESNLSKEEQLALKDLKQDNDIQILPADKGRMVVVLNTSDYKQKCQDLLSDSGTYLKLGKRDPTTKYKKELVSVLQQLEEEGGLNRVQYRQLYPTSETPPKFYGLPKVHKLNIPLRPIVSSVGSITYNCAKFLAGILSPLVGKSKHHVVNSQQFADAIKKERVEPDEELRSYDVTALFTSVPIDKALDVILHRLQEDTTLNQRTSLSPSQVVKLLSVCLKCTYFVYDCVFFQQIHGAAMGSPVSPIVCNLYMEQLELRAIETAPHPPLWWYRYVDDTHTKLKKCHSQEFTDHLNSLDPDIKFTTEEEQDRSLAFLDTTTVIQDDGSLKTKIYRKPTHTDQYLNFYSNHPLQHKLGVIRTLHHRADTVITYNSDREEEKTHINQALYRCGYPKWAVDKATVIQPQKSKTIRKKEQPSKGLVVLPYIKDTSEALKRIFTAYGINTCIKPTKTLRQLLVSPKDKTKKEHVCGVVYQIPCQGQTNTGQCKDSYIGETERSLKTRFLEHRRPSSSTSEVSQHIHIESPGHSVNINEVKILDTETRYFERGVKEAIYIRALKPSLNRDGGRYKLPGTKGTSRIYDNGKGLVFGSSKF